MSAVLPDGFAELEPYVTSWAIAGSNNRALCRDASTADERDAFYAASRPALPQALAYLDQKSLAAFDERDERLMNLMLMLAHVALAVEAQGDAEAAHAQARRYLPITLSPAGA